MEYLNDQDKQRYALEELNYLKARCKFSEVTVAAQKKVIAALTEKLGNSECRAGNIVRLITHANERWQAIRKSDLGVGKGVKISLNDANELNDIFRELKDA